MRTQSKILLTTAVMLWLVGQFLVLRGYLSLPQVWAIGPFTLHFYGLVLGAAIAAGWFVATRRGVVPKVIQDPDGYLIGLVITSFLGARLWHIMSALPHYLAQPWTMFYIWQGGLAVFGAVAGGLIYIFARLTWSKVSYRSFWSVLDWLVPSLALGQGIGRIANLFNYELYGRAAGNWGWFIPPTFRPYGLVDHAFFWPLPTIESAACLLLAFYLICRPAKFPGQSFAIWALSYGIIRLFIELFRMDSTWWQNLPINPIVSICLILLGSGILLRHAVVATNQTRI